MNNPENRRSFFKNFIPGNSEQNENFTKEKNKNKQQENISRRKILRDILVLGLTPVLVNCKLEKDQNDLTPEEQKKFTKINDIVNSFSFLQAGSADRVRDELLAVDPNILDLLTKVTNSQENNIRNTGYIALTFLSKSDNEQMDKQALAVIEKGLTDPEARINAFCAYTCMSNGMKKAIPIMINKLDPKYSDIIMPGEPPVYLPKYAHNAMLTFTEGKYFSEYEPWQKWWDDNKEKLSWDQRKYKFITKQ